MLGSAVFEFNYEGVNVEIPVAKCAVEG